jgi:hydrogenase maturation protease
MKRVAICIGNQSRGDDAVGRRVAALLREAAPPGVEIIEHDGEATALLDALEGATQAIFVDACVSGAPPGAVRRIDATREALPQGELGGSTHGLGLACAIALARALGRLPPICVVYAIEGADFAQGAPLSSEAEAGAREAARRALAEFGG